MGCCSSSQPEANMQGSQRRRLSVGHVDATDGAADAVNDEEDRGIMKELDEAKLLEILSSGDDRRFSLGSETDKDLNKRASFSDKTYIKDGHAEAGQLAGLGYTCRKGLKPESPNQDSWCIIKLDQLAMYGVFDGHGQKGHDISNYVKESLPKLILRDQRLQSKDFADKKQVLIDAYKRCQSLIATQTKQGKLSANMSGTTCTMILHDIEEKKLFVSWAGDSGATMMSASKEGKYLTIDHKPDLKDERTRIENAGGRVVFDGYANHRVYAKNGRYPGLNMSRCLGDLLGHQDAGLSCEPEVIELPVEDDAILLLCSDGVWEFMTAQDAANIVKEFPRAQATQAANALAKEAWDRWIREEGGAVVDDITALVLYLSPSAG